MAQGIPKKSKGWIYILTNRYYSRDIIKIGKTTGSPTERAKKLSSPTGVPDDLKVAYQIEVEDCDIAERMIQKTLKDCLIKEKREWYKLPIWKAITIVDVVVEGINQVSQEIDSYHGGIMEEEFHKRRFEKIKQDKINNTLDSISEDEQDILEKEFEESIKDDNTLWDIYTHNGYIGPVKRKWREILEEKFLTKNERSYEVFKKEIIDRKNRNKKIVKNG